MFPKDPKWFVMVAFDMDETATLADADVRSASRFVVEIFAEEWGVMFCHAGRVSWIRVTDIPFVHGRDEYELLRQTPALKDITRLMCALETRYQLSFSRDRPLIGTNLRGADDAIRRWAASL